MKFESQAAVAATRARVVNPAALPASFDVSIDSRTAAPGQAYLALRGDRFDGHEFVAQALQRGAALAIVMHESALPPGAPGLVVADTFAALLELAKLARAKFSGKVIAITGSTGKTTTKNFLTGLLRASCDGDVAATPLNENNEIGVSKVVLALCGESIAVIELGCRKYRDIETLVEIARPDFGILTNIGDAHLEIMGSRERLAETKWGLFAAGAHPILNAGDAESRRLAPALAVRPEYFALAGDVLPAGPAGRVTMITGRESLSVLVDGRRAESVPIDARMPGDHNLRNLAAACAGALALGADIKRLAATIPSLELPDGRYERIGLGGVQLVFDAYNASLSGTLATLAAFAVEPGRRIAVLGGMAELGPDSVQMHEAAGGAAAQAGVEYLLAGGEFADALERGARSAGMSSERILRYGDNAQAARWLLENTRAGDVVLLKASRKYKLEEIVTALRSQHGAHVA